MNAGSTDGLLPPTPALPPSSIALHIGVHKTGTTALQAALADARPELVRHGVLYPGKKAAHHGAALGLMERSWGWKDRGGEVSSRSVFDKLARQAASSPGRVIISSEHFCEVDSERAAEAADAFGRDRIEIIITLRNLGRLLPSSWQQYLKYGVAAPYETWLENTFAAESKRTVSPSFWRRNNHHVLAQRWADVVGADRVTVIVLEDVDRSAMFRTFAQLLDLPEEILTTRMDLTSNRSMTAAESELVRRLNKEVKHSLNWGEYQRLVRVGVAKSIVERREPAPDEPRLHTPDWALDAAAERGSAMAAGIRESGVRVIGNVDALAARVSSPPRPPDSVLDSVPMDAAVDALATLVLLSKSEPSRKDLTRALAKRLRADAGAKLKRSPKKGG